RWRPDQRLHPRGSCAATAGDPQSLGRCPQHRPAGCELPRGHPQHSRGRPPRRPRSDPAGLLQRDPAIEGRPDSRTFSGRRIKMTGDRIRLGVLGALLLGCVWRPQAHAAVPRTAAVTRPDVELRGGGADLGLAGGTLSLRVLGGNVLHVHFIPAAGATPPTLVMAPQASTPADTTLVMAPQATAPASTPVAASRQGEDLQLRGGQLRVALDEASGALSIFAAGAEHPLLRISRLASLARGAVVLRFAKAAPLYGIGGTDAFDKRPAKLLRLGIQVARAGAQGDAGAPLVWSTAGFGILFDSRGAR